MTREQIEKAANEAVQEHFQCNGKYPCEERDYCEFCNGHNSAFDCREDCGADDFNEGFFAGAQWRINSVWHDASEEPEQEDEPILVEYEDWGIECSGYTVCDDIWDYRIRLKRDGACCTILRWAYIKDLIPERKEETK